MVKWEPLVRYLGLGESVNALPAAINCPFCKGVKTNILYPDPFYNNVWFHCNNCKAAGDPIMLAAQELGMDVRSTAFNLKALDLIDDYYYFTAALDIYQYKVHKAHLKHMAFWEKCKSSDLIFTSTEVRTTCEKLGISVPRDARYWQNGMGKMIGFASREDCESGTAPPKMHEEDDPCEYTKHSGDYRSFIGKHWKNVIVVPFFDMPGRIREFKFISMNEGRLVYANKILHHRKIHQKSAALAFFDQIVKGTNHEDLVVTDTLETAIRLHAKQLKEGRSLLPVVSVADFGQLDFLKSLFPFKFTICNPKLGVETFPAIKASRSKVYIDSNANTVLAKSSTITWLDVVRNSAKDWKEVLENWLLTVRKPEAQAAVGNIEFSTQDFQEIDQGNYPSISDVLKSLDRHNHRVVTVMGEKFYQTTDGWILLSNHNVISAATVTIQSIFKDTDDREKIAGYVSYKQKKHLFFKPSVELKDKGADFIRDVLVDNGIVCVDVDKRFTKFFYDIALAFHTPKVVHVSDNFGWNASEQLFRFKSFSISIDGTYTLDELTTLQRSHTPGSNILPPDDLSKPTVSDFLAIAEDHEFGSTFWLLAAYCVRSLLAPVLGLKPMPVFYYSNKNTEEMIHKVCEILSIVDTEGHKYSDKARNWPMLLPTTLRKRVKGSFEVWLTTEDKPNCIVELRPQELHPLRLLANYPVFNLDAAISGTANMASYRKVMPHFLVWMLSKYGLKLPDRGDTLKSVLDLMRQWLIENNLEPKVFERAEERIKIGADASLEVLMDCLSGICKILVKNKTISVGLSFINNVWLKDDKYVLIEKTKILKVYEELDFRLIDNLEIGDKLREAYTDSNCPEDRWPVPRSWWDDVVYQVQFQEANRKIKRRKPKRA